jgi:hypothetical protein
MNVTVFNESSIINLNGKVFPVNIDKNPMITDAELYQGYVKYIKCSKPRPNETWDEFIENQPFLDIDSCHG